MRVEDLDDNAPPRADLTVLAHVHIRGRQLRQRRRAIRTGALVLLAVALAVGAVAIGSHRGSPNLSVQPNTTVPSPTNEPPTTQPTVGANATPSSVTFESRSYGLGLTFTCTVPPTADPICAFTVAASRDAGRTWTRVGGSSGIRYTGWRGYPDLELAADGPNVWVYGTRTFASHDGGGTFEDQHLKGIVSTLVPKGDNVWAAMQSCALCPTDTLVTASLTGGSWTTVAAFPDVGDPYVDLVRPTTTVAYVLGRDTHIVMYRTNDAGRSWQTSPLPPHPPSSTQTNTVAISALGANQIWMLGGGDASTQDQQKALYRSDDGGTHWILVADTSSSPRSSVGHLPYQGLGFSLTVETSRRIWIPLGAGPFIASFDGGTKWRDTGVSTPTLHHISQLVFVDGVGWAWGGDTNFRTTDGQHWKAITP